MHAGPKVRILGRNTSASSRAARLRVGHADGVRQGQFSTPSMFSARRYLELQARDWLFVEHRSHASPDGRPDH